MTTRVRVRPGLEGMGMGCRHVQTLWSPSLLPQQGLEPRAMDVVGHRVHLVHSGFHVEAADDILGVQLVQVEGYSRDPLSLWRLAGWDVGSTLERWRKTACSTGPAVTNKSCASGFRLVSAVLSA